MYPIAGPGATVDNKFTEGDPVSGVPATTVTDDWMNDVQAELLNILSAAAVTPAINTPTQVLLALRKAIGVVIGSVSNLKMSVATASVTATVTADEVIVGTALGGTCYRLAGFSKSIDISTTGAGGRDVGPGISGYVAIYAIYNPATGVSNLLGVNVTSSVAPVVYGGANMPAGYTASALLTVVPTNVSGQFLALEVKNRDVYIPVNQIFSATTVLTNSGVSLAAAVPQNAVSFGGELSISASVGTSAQIVLAAAAAGGVGLQALQITLAASSSILISYGNVPLRTVQTSFVTTSTTAGTPTFTMFVTNYRI